MAKAEEGLYVPSYCGLPQALEVMGERWSFMILRAAFNGLVHFEEFSAQLGIARNILSNRLGKLVDHGVLERIPSKEDRRKVEYRLTEKGADLLPAVIALRQWGEKYTMSVPSNPVLVDAKDHLPIAPIEIRAQDGRKLGWRDLAWEYREEEGEKRVVEEPEAG
ncbi:DNA-binding HxlR family transcriptional regulator [Altererythrobacter atlanticus]|uniref:HTH-type transcriptional regulator YybR n=1 Tax=Croceibacterium atlanticum TaxID=1267766 RepID=A0A0F7KTZ5_9SPHN|nr:helix-turn-helix domain-containing protein [Croceibacterium atlanticum]AKH42747.1 putative HTH-type transcriptional regulator YybR [Croceibacterium atlanticum]MBB5731528.1 DNA-binding HxlR family transcriptional regulator [Croceibacterium atlanticum]